MARVESDLEVVRYKLLVSFHFLLHWSSCIGPVIPNARDCVRISERSDTGPQAPSIIKAGDLIQLRGESRLFKPWQEAMDDPNAWPDIYSAALDCDLLFDKCLTQIAEPRTIGLLNESAAAVGRLARDHQARFQAWASYLGVFAEEDVCLDRRLSKSKDVQIMVINLLRTIFLNLRYCESLFFFHLETIIATELKPSFANNPNKRQWYSQDSPEKGNRVGYSTVGPKH